VGRVLVNSVAGRGPAARRDRAGEDELDAAIACHAPEGGAGSSGALVQGEGRTPGRAGTLVYLNVADMDAALARVESSGGRVLLPKASGEFGSIAHFEDCEGNLVALYSR
jgi:predicted enzyme related to lactoylglutathione lyase